MMCSHPLERLQLLVYWRRNTDHTVYCRDCDTYWDFPHTPELVGRACNDILARWKEAYE